MSIKKLLTYPILYYLRGAAKLQLSKFNPIIIGVTGSAGKTSTRLAITQILKKKGIVKQSVHANSETGIPLNILGITPRSFGMFDWLRMLLLVPIRLIIDWRHYSYYVVEMGIDSPDFPKNMSYLLSLVKPHVGVILNATLAHSGPFDHLVKDAFPKRRQEKLISYIAAEKGKLITTLPATGTAIINIDQPEFTPLTTHTSFRILSFGKTKAAKLRILKVKNDRAGFSFTFVCQHVQYLFSTPNILEDNYAYTLSAAILTGIACGSPISQSLVALSEFHSAPGRLRVFAGIKDSTILDSSYNASPATMLSCLETLRSLGGKARKIAVLGDMRELGGSTKKVHQDLASWLQKYSSEAILFGKDTAEYTLPILQRAKFPVQHFTQMTDLIIYLKTRLKKKVWVLIKGSQNEILLERAVESILADPFENKKLCRRGKYWDKVRSQVK